MVELEIVENISHETERPPLKKRTQTLAQGILGHSTRTKR
jgi:hypothetical protein